jgi:hypothetical protein
MGEEGAVRKLEKASQRVHHELRAYLDSPFINQRTDDAKTPVLATRVPAAGARSQARRRS